MSTDADALQGNLFGEPVNASGKSTEPSETHATKSELSDLQLAEDAQKRPRRRQKGNSDGLQKTSNLKNQPLKEDANYEKPRITSHSEIDRNQLTPVLKHYVDLKISNPDRILLYRLGDFFECFFEDAIEVSRLLEITLTGKEGGKTIGRVPMAGIPHHAAERYCAELIRRGISVALCDQLETTPSKGNLLKREITRVLTPGTVIEEGMLAARKNNWLAALILEENNKQTAKSWALAQADVSTGDFILKQGQSLSSLQQEIAQLEVSELLLNEADICDKNLLHTDNLHLTDISSTPFTYPEAKNSLVNYYKLTTIDGLGLNEFPLAIRAAGGLISYLHQTKPRESLDNHLQNAFPPLDIPKLIYSDDFLIIDSQTRRNLELTATQRDNKFHGSFLWAIDRTLTAMGGRCLRRWIENPLMNSKAINDRQKLIYQLINNRSLRKEIRNLLRSMGDLERISGRAGAKQAGGRDLEAIADGLERIPNISQKLQERIKVIPNILQDLCKFNPNLIKLAERIRDQLIHNPPLNISEGGLIHDGVDPILDGLRNQIDDQEDWLKSQEKIEKELSQIPNLKLQYHRTFGYFLSVTKARANKVPDHWIRRQTLSNEERFITPPLKERESKIFQLKARAAQREYELFCNLREVVGSYTDEIRKAARAIASLDALSGLAELAATENYCMPEIIDSKESNNRLIEVKECRHPVVEQILVEENFTPNDLKLGSGTDLIILTGPNASGKSCFLRQIGLIQLLTQIGSWVPARQAKIGLVDRIFTRVGAVDDLAAGQSTFIVEMAETANILNNATNKSLVLLDEIGRGTSTFDGLSIAWSVSEYLAENIGSKTIFATHYHELNSLKNIQKNIANFQVIVKETGDELIFLHRVEPGGANQSYGIEAARLAGVPQIVLDRAKGILKQLETQNTKQ